MDKRFRNLILAQVEAVVYDKPPSRQSLYELLKIATPDLKLHMVDNTSQRQSAYKALKVLIHPDKHAKALKNDKKELQRVTKIFQETSAYYNVCCSRLALESPSMGDNNSFGETETPTKKRESRHTKGSKSSKSPMRRTHSGFDQDNISNKRDFRPPSIISVSGSGRLPVEFDSYEEWPYLTDMVKVKDMESVSVNELAWIMACRVINLRGGVIHGQAIGRAYQVTKKSSDLEKCDSVDAVLRHFGFVCRSKLSRVQDIKYEIMEHGPVISTSFELHKAFYQSSDASSNFSPNQVSRIHPLLLVGWTMTSQGELWKVQALQSGETFEIGTGQFNVSASVLAPPDAILETIPWQSSGPYLDLNMPSVVGLSKDWRDLRHMSISISAKELETFSKMLEGGFQAAIKSKQSFVIRDKHKLAYSRRYTLREIATGDSGKWKISVSQAES
ncbi:expressed unknown protein [Seminavis robusta]|uniref:J domain-containing protein n=1 Tax=Seminavis robusta TaxID=568900 RepID=A0A9N8DH02_9STRA|nr:expressed unknown protein [Seminavis robusta]|eukprot:Sro86_g045690.1 n/a (445) ;mRNA; r:46537-47871